jgi:hypothetical protein
MNSRTNASPENSLSAIGPGIHHPMVGLDLFRLHVTCGIFKIIRQKVSANPGASLSRRQARPPIHVVQSQNWQNRQGRQALSSDANSGDHHSDGRDAPAHPLDKGGFFAK